MHDDTPQNNLVELKALYAMLRFASARAEELGARPLAHAIDRAQKIARAEIELLEAQDLLETTPPNSPSKLCENG